MYVSETMSDHVKTIAPTKTLRQAGRLMCQSGVGSLPVVADGKVVGMITDRDISCFAVAMGRDPNSTEVKIAMSDNVVTCYADQEIDYAAFLMKQRNVRRLVIIDENDNVVGLLSLEDLARGSYELAGSVLEASKATH